MSDFKLFFPGTPSEVWVNFLIRRYKVLKSGDLQEKCKKCKACSGYENILLTLLCLPRNKGLAVSHSFKTPSPENAWGSLPFLGPIPSRGSVLL